VRAARTASAGIFCEIDPRRNTGWSLSGYHSRMGEGKKKGKISR
jgi:hypothetical protein